MKAGMSGERRSLRRLRNVSPPEGRRFQEAASRESNGVLSRCFLMEKFYLVLPYMDTRKVTALPKP